MGHSFVAFSSFAFVFFLLAFASFRALRDVLLFSYFDFLILFPFGCWCSWPQSVHRLHFSFFPFILPSAYWFSIASKASRISKCCPQCARTNHPSPFNTRNQEGPRTKQKVESSTVGVAPGNVHIKIVCNSAINMNDISFISATEHISRDVMMMRRLSYCVAFNARLWCLRRDYIFGVVQLISHSNCNGTTGVAVATAALHRPPRAIFSVFPLAIYIFFVFDHLIAVRCVISVRRHSLRMCIGATYTCSS